MTIAFIKDPRETQVGQSSYTAVGAEKTYQVFHAFGHGSWHLTVDGVEVPASPWYVKGFTTAVKRARAIEEGRN